jgi:hypothetical protein
VNKCDTQFIAERQQKNLSHVDFCNIVFNGMIIVAAVAVNVTMNDAVIVVINVGFVVDITAFGAILFN